MQTLVEWIRDNSASSLSAATALLSVLASAITYLLQVRNARRRLEAAKEREFLKALNSDAIEELGAYLDNVIGAFRIAEYAENPAARQRVDAYLGRIQTFVGTIDELLGSPVPAAVPAPRVQVSSTTEPLVQEVAHGETWNALAKLRRSIELRLRQIARDSQVSVSERGGAGRLLESLARAERLDPAAIGPLRYAISVANRAIHGEPVDPDTAQAAVMEGLFGLEMISQTEGRDSGA